MKIKKGIFFHVLLCVLSLTFFQSKVFAEGLTYNFLWSGHAGQETKIVCSNYGEEIAIATLTFYDQNGTRFSVRRMIGKVSIFSTKDFGQKNYFSKIGVGIVEIKFDENEELNVNCISSMQNGTGALFQKREDIRTKESYISYNTDVMGSRSTTGASVVTIGNFADKATTFKVLVYDKDGNLKATNSLGVSSKRTRTLNLASAGGYYKTIHIEPQGDEAKYVAYIKVGSTFLKPNEAFEEGKLLPARGKLLLTNTYFTPALYTYSVYEGKEEKYRGHMYVRPFAQKVVDLETYTKDFNNPTIKLESIDAYIPTRCPEYVKVCHEKEKPLFLLGEVVQNTYRANNRLDTSKNYHAENNGITEGNEFEVPFAKLNASAFLNIYQEDEREGKVVLVSRKTGKEKTYKITGKEELKVNVSDITTLSEDSIQVISQNRVSVIFENGNNTQEYYPTRDYEKELEEEEEIMGQMGPGATGSEENCPPPLEDSDPYTPSANSEDYEKNENAKKPNECEPSCAEGVECPEGFECIGYNSKRTKYACGINIGKTQYMWSGHIGDVNVHPTVLMPDIPVFQLYYKFPDDKFDALIKSYENSSGGSTLGFKTYPFHAKKVIKYYKSQADNEVISYRIIDGSEAYFVDDDYPSGVLHLPGSVEALLNPKFSYYKGGAEDFVLRKFVTSCGDCKNGCSGESEKDFVKCLKDKINGMEKFEDVKIGCGYSSVPLNMYPSLAKFLGCERDGDGNFYRTITLKRGEDPICKKLKCIGDERDIVYKSNMIDRYKIKEIDVKNVKVIQFCSVICDNMSCRPDCKKDSDFGTEGQFANIYEEKIEKIENSGDINYSCDGLEYNISETPTVIVFLNCEEQVRVSGKNLNWKIIKDKLRSLGVN